MNSETQPATVASRTRFFSLSFFFFLCLAFVFGFSFKFGIVLEGRLQGMGADARGQEDVDNVKPTKNQ